MTEYCKLQVSCIYSRNSDFSDPLVKTLFDAYELSSPTKFEHRVYEASTTNFTVDLSTYTTIPLIVVKNLDASGGQTVRIGWDELKGTQTIVSNCDFLNSNPDTIQDTSAAGTFVTNGAVAAGFVRCSGSAQSGNNTRFLIQTAAANLLTLASSEALTAEDGSAVATTIILRFLKENDVHVVPTGLIAGNNVDPDGDLRIKVSSASGTASVEVFIAGT